MEKEKFITRTEKVPCEIDICMDSQSYKIQVNTKWLCKEHMQELLNYLQFEFEEISKNDRG